ncbi:MAG: L-serine ammonia-lyase, iron-sulfur-dependent, subunit alpha [Bacteroidales bacterium]|nr:L-serine ammonia-lyase, iron-sulfur-dependent, subunit alpha [Bacteroidales bacterium]
METIKKIYKAGYGPSSSHTMGPHRAAEMFRQRTPQAAGYRVTLYGSLAATGRGHHTDKAIKRGLCGDGLDEARVELVWHSDVVKDFHPNGMLYEALDTAGAVTQQWLVYSIGGGNLATEEGEVPLGITPEGEVYPHNTMGEIMAYVEREGLSLWEYVEQCEDQTLWPYLEEMWQQMQQTIAEGLQDDRVIAGGLHLRSKAHQYHVRASGFKPSLQSRALVIAYALATSEQNACGGRIVTAPTCGSSGVLPAVLFHLKTAHGFTDREILRAMATAGLFANVIKTNASIAGAEVGCQGEVGSACVMAAAASNQLFGGSPKQIEYAAEMAMEHNLGLTCDPLCGLVQVPCIERNAMAALRALDINIYAMMSDGHHLISFDKVVRTMKLTGKDLPSLYKETSLGGLALAD